MKQSYLQVIAIGAGLLVCSGLVTRAASAQDKFVSVKDQSMSHLLGWVSDPDNGNICHGYYVANRVIFPSTVSQKNTVIESKNITYYADQASILNEVHVLQPGREMTAEQAYSVLNTKDWSTNILHVEGNIHLNEAGMLAVADQGQVNLKDNSSELTNVVYRLSRNYLENSRLPVNPKNIPNSKTKTYKIDDLTARGEADKITQDQPDIVDLYQATYSTCAPNTNTWHVKASKIHLDRASGNGTATNMRLYLHQVPVFYFPYFSFPIDLQRKSGFLYPIFRTGNGDTQIAIPYYWNIAPNYDATITPSFFTERGLQINTLFNYLTWDQLGKFYFSFLPDDREFKAFQQEASTDPGYNTQPGYARLANDSTDREFISLQDQYIIDSNWSSVFNFNYVNDDYYFQDFSNQPSDALTQNQMLELGIVNYDSLNWHVSTMLQNYQTLHPVNNTAIIPDQYAHYPQIDFDADYPLYNHFDYQLYGEFVNFRSPLITENYDTNLPSVMGQRYDLKPVLSFPTYTSSFHFVPSVEYDATAYDLVNQPAGQSNNLSRGLPLFDIDTGLYYQRSASFFGNQYNQTFEPKLFYLYVPDKNQDDLPLFDTATKTFTFDSLFDTNRFTGIDRIGDANQLSYGATSRLINSATGLDRFDASLGQIVYFEDRQVNINDLGDNLNPTNKLSPLVGQMRFQFLQNWYAVGNGAWQNTGNYFSNASLGIQYLPNTQNVFSISYNFLQNGDPLPNNYEADSSRNNLNQIEVAQTWELTKRWSLYQSINYNASHHFTQTYLYGIGYNSCCWAVRVVATRTLFGLDTNNNPVYDSGVAIQFALKGLSNVGSGSPGNTLNSSIPGYVDEFGKEKLPAAQPYSA